MIKTVPLHSHNTALKFAPVSGRSQMGVYLFVLLFVSGIFSNSTNAQVAGYTFTENTAAYSAIAGTVVHASGWGDPAPVSVTIPFTFTFDNVGYTACSVNGNGYITFGGTASIGAI